MKRKLVLANVYSFAFFATTAAFVASSGYAQTDGGVSYYTSRNTFVGEFPGLAVEDFEDLAISPSSVQGFQAPLDATSNVPGIVTPGAILPGISIYDDPGPDSGGLAAVGAGFAGNPNICIVANTFTDTMAIDFDPPVSMAGMDLMSFFDADTLTLALYSESLTLIDTTMSSGTNDGTFWGFASPTPVARLTIASPTDQAEGIDNLTFSAPPAGSRANEINVTQATMRVDFRSRLQKQIRDTFSMRGSINMEVIAESGVNLLDPGLTAEIEIGGHSTDLGPVTRANGSRYRWDGMPTPPRTVRFDLDIRSGAFRFSMSNEDLVTATAAPNGMVAEGTLEVPIVIHVGAYAISTTIETLYRSVQVDRHGDARFKPGKAPSAVSGGLFFVRSASVQERGSGKGTVHRLTMDVVFTPDSGSPLDLTPTGTNGCMLSVGPFMETVGNGSAKEVFEVRGSSYSYSHREPIFPAAVTSMRVDERKWSIQIRTAWVPAGTFGLPALFQEGKTSDVSVPVSLFADGELLGAGPVVMYRSRGRWQTGFFNPFGNS